MVVYVGNYRVRPYGSKPGRIDCWQVDRYDEGGTPIKSRPGQVTEPGWRSMGKYPHTLEDALDWIAQWTLAECDEQCSGKELPKILNRHMRELRQSVRVAVLQTGVVPDDPPALLAGDCCRKGRQVVPESPTPDEAARRMPL